MYEDAIKTSGHQNELELRELSELVLESLDLPVDEPVGAAAGGEVGTVSKETGFHERLATLTDQWMDLFGYLAPSVVTDVADEYRAVRETAGLMDFTMLRKVDLEGPGALELVNSVVGRDVSKLQQGRIAYGPLVDESGKMVDDCTVMLRAPDRVRSAAQTIVTSRSSVPRRGNWDRGARVHGRDAASLPAGTAQPRDPPVRRRSGSLDGVFPYYTFREDVSIAGIPIFMTRLGYTAELGYELWVDRDRALDLWDALVDAGAAFRMRVIGMLALDLFRIEGGFIIGGVEYNPSVSPYECGLGWAVSYDKPRVRGRAGLERGPGRIDVAVDERRARVGGDDASGAKLSSTAPRWAS